MSYYPISCKNLLFELAIAFMMSLPTCNNGEFYYGFEPLQLSASHNLIHNSFPIFTYEDSGQLLNDTDLDFNILSDYILNDDSPLFDPILPLNEYINDVSTSTPATISHNITSPKTPSSETEEVSDEDDTVDDGKGKKRKKSDKSREQVDRRRYYLITKTFFECPVLIFSCLYEQRAKQSTSSQN